MKHYTALTCTSDRETLDILVAATAHLPITGILDNETSLVLYFDEGSYDESTMDDIARWLPGGAQVEFELGGVEEQNWNAEFERSLQPIHIHPGLTITQSWNPVELNDPDELVVLIDPKMSFGTGHHESTRLIAELMMAIDFTDKRVLDVGTGTGVLAIVAARRGASRVIAFDNNEWAVANTRENLALNEALEEVEVLMGEMDVIQEGDFDIVLANMHRNIIIELLPEIVRRMRWRDESMLLTSGVLAVDHDSLVDAARAVGLRVADSRLENEWISTLFVPSGESA